MHRTRQKTTPPIIRSEHVPPLAIAVQFTHTALSLSVIGRRCVRVEGGREGKHGPIGAIPTEEQRNHRGGVLWQPFILCRRLGSGNQSRTDTTSSGGVLKSRRIEIDRACLRGLYEIGMARGLASYGGRWVGWTCKTSWCCSVHGVQILCYLAGRWGCCFATFQALTREKNHPTCLRAPAHNWNDALHTYSTHTLPTKCEYVHPRPLPSPLTRA